MHDLGKGNSLRIFTIPPIGNVVFFVLLNDYQGLAYGGVDVVGRLNAERAQDGVPRETCSAKACVAARRTLRLVNGE